MLLSVQGSRATDNEDEMLLGELAPIVQCIRNRLEQKEFADTDFFPVSSRFFGKFSVSVYTDEKTARF